LRATLAKFGPMAPPPARPPWTISGSRTGFTRAEHGSNRHRKKLEAHIYASTTIADAAKEFGISASLIEKAKILVRDGAPHIIEMVARGDLGVVTAAEAARGVPRSEQQSWTRSRPRRAR